MAAGLNPAPARPGRGWLWLLWLPFVALGAVALCAGLAAWCLAGLVGWHGFGVLATLTLALGGVLLAVLAVVVAVPLVVLAALLLATLALGAALLAALGGVALALSPLLLPLALLWWLLRRRPAPARA